MGALQRYKEKESKLQEFGISDFENVEYTKEMTDALMQNVYSKDLRVGMLSSAVVYKIDKDTSELHTPAGSSVFVGTSKENRFLNEIGFTDLHIGDELNVIIESISNSVYYGSIEKASQHVSRLDFKDALMKDDRAYEGVVKSCNDGGYMVMVAGLMCFMPNSHAGTNRIADSNNLIGKSVKVMIEGYIESSDMYVVSVRKYIKKIMPNEITKLDLMTQHTGRVTGITNYGIFVEWDDIFTGLIYETEAQENWQAITVGSEIKFHIKEIRGEDRIVLTQKGVSEEMIKLTDFKAQYEGSIVDGYVSEIIETADKKITGAVVEVCGVTGFLPYHQIRNMKKFEATDLIEVYVGSVDVINRRVSLRSPKNVK